VPRTKGAKNKSWREVEAEGKYKVRLSKLMREKEELKKALKNTGKSK
jgi:hypothetical protein